MIAIALLAFSIVLLGFLIRFESVQALDNLITYDIQRLRTPYLDTLLTFITHLGGSVALSTVTILSVGAYYLLGYPREAFLISICFLVLPLNLLLKEIFHRPRPAKEKHAILVRTRGKSFPSGHTMCSTAIYGFNVFLLAALTQYSPQLLIGSAFGLLTLIGISRTYVGAHWFTDVLCGWSAGTIIVLLLVTAY
ncbi:MAG TPA: phosphatase PAP2 family protein [Verrucomicrobiae bacterium]|nr:phosphatase PAP2 family protein [Verrucomicrobiae bacterium]